MDKIWYRAAPGVEWVNGARVPEDRRIRLDAKEAAYDIGLGRIEIDGSGEEPRPAEVKPRGRSRSE